MSDSDFDPQAEREFVADLVARKHHAMERFMHQLAQIPKFLRIRNSRSGGPLNSDELCDVEQDVRVAVLRCLENYRPLKPLQAWIYGVCANQFREAVRAKLRLRGRQHSENDNDPLDSIPAPDSEDAPEWGHIEHLLETVGGIESQIIRHKILDELTFAEISEHLSMPANTVKTRYYRGLKRIRWRLEDEQGGPS